jgi:broad specificity phosphatase PhoE
MSIQIYLARHGETSLNAAGLLRGRLDPSLTDRGREQAGALARAFSDKDIRLVISSPLQRAVETARAVADACRLSVEIDMRFNDRDYGDWAGTSLAGVSAQWGSVDDAPGVEPRDAVVERALAGFLDAADALPSGAVLIVSHDAVNRPLLVALDPSLAGRAIPQETGCYNVLRSSQRGWLVESVNNVPQL